MKFADYLVVAFLCLSSRATEAQAPQLTIQLNQRAPVTERVLEEKDFSHPPQSGWTIQLDVSGRISHPPSPAGSNSGPASLLSIAGSSGKPWLEAQAATANGEEQLQFLLHTDYRIEPLLLEFPVRLMQPHGKHSFLLRYQSFRLDLFYNGVLVDEEWPSGNIEAGTSPTLKAVPPVIQLSLWNRPLPDATITAMNGGLEAIEEKTTQILGPEPQFVQYSRPRGYNTNAGDAMPFYHDGTFHLYYLLDRRQHHSKWGLGAHQWGHISSTDLIHWTHYPVALGIDYEWEGSICTGSIFFHNGHYYAHYATRMPDRSEHLAVAESVDAIHFTKTIPTPFAEPTEPYVRGPNRDPFVFENNGQFHMLVTAAVGKPGLQRSEGALEHLISDDLSHWTVAKEPFLLAGSEDQPECSDLYFWKGWYYLLYSLRGTTHYKISRNALGPWTTPANEILDGPEAIVMKAAEFKGDRRLLVGFLQHDNRYGGDLIFRELIQEKDGALGTTTPREMDLPILATKTLRDIQVKPGKTNEIHVTIGKDSRIAAKLAFGGDTSVALSFGKEGDGNHSEKLIFDPATASVTWIDATGKPAHAELQHVTDLAQSMKIVLTLKGSVADLSINSHRTLIHRLSSDKQHREISFTSTGGNASVTEIQVSALK